MGTEPERFVQFIRSALSPYGRDYAIGAVRGLAVRNMMSIPLPEPSEGFYPIVKVHEMALKDLEDVFYKFVQWEETRDNKKELILKLVDQRVWE